MTNLAQLLKDTMSQRNHSPQDVAAACPGLTVPLIENYIAGKRFPTARNDGISSISSYLGMPVDDLQALKPKQKRGGGRKPGRPPGKAAKGSGKKQAPEGVAGAAMATLNVFGQSVGFSTVDELLGYLNGQAGEISIEVMGRKLNFGALGEVNEWVKQFESLFDQK